MKLKMVVTALAALTAGVAHGREASPSGTGDEAMAPGGSGIVVSCYRGPWRAVIWDRPNAVFIQSLVDAGYDFATAEAIAQQICRDENLVGRPGAMAEAMRKILRQQPPR